MMKKISFSKPLINKKDSLSLIKKVINSNFPNEGKFTNRFEKIAKKILKSKYAVATTSGTAAIYLALKALDVKPGDEVVIPNITFQATANAVKMTGATVKLVDIDPHTLLIDLFKLKKVITNKTKVVIPVHISGRGQNINELVKFCKKNKIEVIEDSAEAFGSKYKNKSLGSFGRCGCFSFAPNKIITTGQGGLIITNEINIYKKLLALKNQGRIGESTGGQDDFICEGTNLRFTNLQAAIGISQLKTFEKRKKKLISIYKFYKKNINENHEFKIFSFDKGEIPLWTDAYCAKRDKLIKFLKNNGIQCRPYWFTINSTKPYKSASKNLLVSQKIQKKLLWLPSSLSITKTQQKKVCNMINFFFKINLNDK